MINKIEYIVSNKYTNLTKEEQNKYILEEIKSMIDKNIMLKANMNEIINFIKLNNYKFDSYVLKLINYNKINKEELMRKLEEKNEKF